MRRDSRHRVVALCLDGLVAFDLTAATQVFLAASEADGTPLYEVSTCSPGGAEVATTTGFGLRPEHGLDALGRAETIVVPGYFAVLEPPPAAVTEALRRAAGRGARALSVCTGAFALAHAGLLDGRRATTHWGWCDLLQERFPQAEVERDPIFVRDGSVVTSAGVTAGIDMALALVEEDLGPEVAREVARVLVVFVQRPGGQSQFSAQMATPVPARQDLRELQAWIVDHPEVDLSIAVLAERSGMSARHLRRVFRDEVGTTPAQYVETVRIEAVRRLLESSDLGLRPIARRTGFGTVETLHRAFRRSLRVTPLEYRRRFVTSGNTLTTVTT